MSVARWWLCALLLGLIALPLCLDGLRATAYGGWPAIGFAVALFLVAGPERRWLVAVVQAVVTTPFLAMSYEVALWQGLLGSLAIVLPALLSQSLLSTTRGGRLLLDEVDSARYYLATVSSSLLCGLIGALAASTMLSPHELLLAGLMSFLAALTSQLVVLPLMIRTSGNSGSAGTVELVLQRLLMAFLVLVVFVPSPGLSVAFILFPVLGWGAIRASRREAHIQLFVVCLAVYVLTYTGHGPLTGPVDGLSDELSPALFYLFVLAAAYLIVPLTVAEEKLLSMTGQANRAATTVERLLYSASGTVFIATDAYGQMTHYNSGAQQTLGYSAEEMLGRSPSVLHTHEETARQARDMNLPPDYFEVVLEMARRGEKRDWEFLHKDGSKRMISLTLSQVTDTEGAVVGYIAAGEDITERLRAQEALMTALEREHASVLRLEEVDHVKQELVSNVSHELRTPITSISGYTELLSDQSLGDLNEAQLDAIVRIERNTSRLGLLVEDLLTLSRTESGQLDFENEEVDLRLVAREAFEMLDEVVRDSSQDVRLDLPAEPVVVLGDAHALERVAANLLGNAIKFTPDDGTVTLSLDDRADGVHLVVSDDGMGIAPEDQELLFTRFYRAPSATEQAIQGTGLGLSIVHAIVTQHGGTVAIDSAPGEGTIVTVVLPHPPDEVPELPLAD